MVQSLGVELEKLDSIRMEFKVHVYPSSAVEDYICVAGLKESDAGPILAQLRALSDEAIAKFNACVKAHMIEPPSHDAYMDDVVIVKYPHGAETLLQRAPSPARSVNDWSGEMERIKEANKKLLLSSVEKSLSMSHFFKGHLQMRVHFGSFVLDTAQRPKNATTGHGFEEFRTMLFLEKAKGRLIPRYAVYSLPTMQLAMEH